MAKKMNLVEVRYRGISDDQVWSGRGRKPEWVIEYLKNGGDLQSLRVLEKGRLCLKESDAITLGGTTKHPIKRDPWVITGRFKTKQELISWLESHRYSEYEGNFWCEGGTYFLSHGELDRPKYYIRRYKDSWGLRVEYFFIPGTFTLKANGRVSDRWFDDIEQYGQEAA